MSKEIEKCAFCQKPFNRREVFSLTPWDFQITCARHRFLKEVYNVKVWLRLRNEKLRKKFGIKKV